MDPLTANYKDPKGGKERGKEGGKGRKGGKLEIIFPAGKKKGESEEGRKRKMGKIEERGRGKNVDWILGTKKARRELSIIM